MFAVRVAAFMGIWAVAAALYEDQVGKWDWLQKHIGPVELVNLGLISTGAHEFRQERFIDPYHRSGGGVQLG